MNSPIIISVDSEYKTLANNKTKPISIQIYTPGREPRFYLHPDVELAQEERKHPTFKTPFVVLDYLNFEWDFLDDPESIKKTLRLELHLFFSFKDIEFLFAQEFVYRDFVLPRINRQRRIYSRRVFTLPFKVKVPNDRDHLEYHKLTLDVLDISAMQGSGSLGDYAYNAGIEMPTKVYYTPDEKSDMLVQYRKDCKKFEEYALGDVEQLPAIRLKTNEFYNKVASLIGVKERDKWGLTVGRVVSTLFSEWLSNKVETPPEEFYKLTKLAGSKGIVRVADLLQHKGTAYAAMVDGGRAIKERELPERYVEGILADIDISGCYGNGLLNQSFPVGVPRYVEGLTLREFLKKYEKQLVPGLWHARISYDNAPFAQDLLISKEEKEINWDNAIADDSDEVDNYDDDVLPIDVDSDSQRVYDASMVLTTRSVSRAIITHDLLQILKHYSSNQEWGWLLDNARIDSALLYLKKDKVKKVKPEMFKAIEYSKRSRGFLDACYSWVEVKLSDLLSILLSERKKHKKGTPMNTFLKLIINTIYGCTASSFFSDKGSGCSNAVVGNNITARARALVWCMAKGFHSYCSITDGGVFDVNKVLRFRKTSLDLFERLHRDVFTDNKRYKFCDQVPLFGRVVTEADIPEIKEKIDATAWDHLASIFPKLDIFKYNQFSFENKDIYAKYTPHSKVDYRLVKHDGSVKIALRGMPKVYDPVKNKKVTDPRANELFDAIEKDTPMLLEIQEEELLSYKDWLKHEKKHILLPHDVVTKTRRFYSHTPLGDRYTDLKEYKKAMRKYEKAKETRDPYQVAQL